MSKNGIRVGFHTGRIVQYLAATYGRWDQVVCELVQNFLDARASEAQITIDLKHNRLMAWDNGEGATMEEMRRRFENIGEPIKARIAKKRGPQIGRRGIGNLAPIALRTETSVWSFFSHKPKSRDHQRWFQITLDMAKLDLKKELDLPSKHMPPGFKPFDFKGNVVAGVNTLVAMTDLEPTSLRELTKLAEGGENAASTVAHSVAETFSATLLRLKPKVVIHVIDSSGVTRSEIVKPQKYPGEKREVQMGEVGFEIYVTKTPIKKKIRLHVEHEELINFALSGQKDLWELVGPVLGSGHFQGIIRTSLGELVPNRTRLKYNDEYSRFCDAVIEFTTNHAERWLGEIRERAREDRVSRVVEEVLEKIAPFVEEYPDLLAEVFKATKNPVGRPTSEDQEEGVFHRATRGATKQAGGSPKGGRAARTKDKPDGASVIRGGTTLKHACGLSVKVIDADPSHPYGTRWRVRLGDVGLERGLVLLNRSHGDWVESESSGDSALHTYISLLILGTLATPWAATTERGQVFKEEFEENFLRFRGPLVPRIPSYGKQGPKARKKD